MKMAKKMVLIALEEFADKHGGNCFPSMSTIAELAGCCSKTVRRHLGRPCEWLRRVPRKGRGQGWRGFEYQLVIPEGADTRSARSGRGVRSMASAEANSLGATRGPAVPDVGKVPAQNADSLPSEQSIYLGLEQGAGKSAPSAPWLEQDHEYQSMAIEVRHHLGIGVLSPEEGRARLALLLKQAESRYESRKRATH